MRLVGKEQTCCRWPANFTRHSMRHPYTRAVRRPCDVQSALIHSAPDHEIVPDTEGSPQTGLQIHRVMRKILACALETGMYSSSLGTTT